MPPFSKFKDILSSHRCQTCGAVFKKEEEYRNHIKIHQLEQAGTPSEPTFMPQFFGAGSCPSCGLPFNNKSKKEAHELEHQELSKNPFLVANHACYYIGYFPNLGMGEFGNLFIYSNPYRIVLKLEKTELTLSFDNIKKVQLIKMKEGPSVGDVLLLGALSLTVEKEVPYFLLGYKSESGVIVECVFKLYHLHEFYYKLQQLRIEYKKLSNSAELE